MATARAWKETGVGRGKSHARLEELTEKEPSHPEPGAGLWRGQLPLCPLLWGKERCGGAGTCGNLTFSITPLPHRPGDLRDPEPFLPQQSGEWGGPRAAPLGGSQSIHHGRQQGRSWPELVARKVRLRTTHASWSRAVMHLHASHWTPRVHGRWPDPRLLWCGG